MAYKTCPDCGSRVFNLGCVNCNEEDYIEEQKHFDEKEQIEREEIQPREFSNRR